MSTYREIVGKKIKKVTSDPSTGIDGQMWYNSTTGAIRGLAVLEAWSAGASTATSKQRSGGCGTQTAGLNCGGFAAPPNGAAHDGTEEYNGSGWSTGGTLNTARGNTKLVGTQTAAVYFGQNSPNTGVTEEYNGTAWTTVNPMANAINYRSGCGIQTAALATGGNVPGTNRSNLNEEYDGTNWSTGGALPQKQSSQGQAGTQTAAINSFGYTNNPVPGNSGDALNAISLEYDGSGWTAGPNGNGVVELTGFAMGSGTQTDAIFAGAPSTNSCKYDGTSFTAGPALAIAQDSASHGSTSASATWIAKGSPVPSVGNRVQDFNRSTNVITAAAWASGGNLNTARNATAASGTQTAALCAAGQEGPGSSSPSAKTEEYDGTSWSEQNDLGTARFYISGSGIQTASLAVAGRTGPGPNFATTVVEEYDGSSWSEQNDIPTAANGMMGAGTQTAAVHFGGVTTPGGSSLTGTYEYDGTNWTSGGSLPTGARYGMGVGTQTAALHAGGGAASSFYYNGTSLSDQSSNLLLQDNPTYQHYGGMSGTQTAALLAGGGNPSSGAASALTQGWDGSVWFTQPSLGTARFYGAQGGAGTSTAGIAFSGQAAAPPYANLTATEEFTPESTAANVKDFTTS